MELLKSSFNIETTFVNANPKFLFVLNSNFH